MDFGLHDKVALVTGGSKGIGFACAQAFVREGARVAVVGRGGDRARASAEALSTSGRSAHAVVADLRDADAAARMVQEVEQALGPIDILVNSAGAAVRTPPLELQPASWHAAMDAKFFTYIHAMQAVLGGMVARKGGVIVNVVGVGGKVANKIHLPGGAANAALMLASAGLANAFAEHGIRVNVVNPGLTATERLYEGFAAQSRMTGETVEQLLERQTRAAPMGRIATPEDVAAVVVFLASKAAGYVSGSIVTVDGAATPIVV